MNWFQRYGIVGAYFIIFTLGWLYVFDKSWYTLGKFTPVVQFGVLSFLPLGYIIATFSQCLYSINCPAFSDTIYREIIRKHRAGSNPENEDANFENQLESLIEANLMVPGRLTGPIESNNRYKDKNIERLKWFSPLTTKRWDVYAISNSLILATLLSFTSAFAIYYYLGRLTGWPNLLVLILVLIDSILFLMCLSSLISKLINKDNNKTQQSIKRNALIIIVVVINGIYLYFNFDVNFPIMVPGVIYLCMLSVLLFSRIMMKERLIIMYADMFNAYPDLAGRYKNSSNNTPRARAALKELGVEINDTK